MQLLHDVSAIRGGFNTLIEFRRSLSAQLKESEARVEGCDWLLEVTWEREQKLEELVTLQTSSTMATQELEAYVVEKEGLLAEK